jgi:hypothetical protein
MNLRFDSLKIAPIVLLLQALINGLNIREAPAIYGSFVLFDLVLAYGLYVENRTAVKLTLIYLGIDLFLAIAYLIAGVLLKGVVAFLDFLAIHDIVGYIERVVEKESREEGQIYEGDGNESK